MTMPWLVCLESIDVVSSTLTAVEPEPEPEPVPSRLVILEPSGANANHVPPTPWPLRSPRALSLLKGYIGQPARVNCTVPSVRRIAPTLLLSTPVTYTAPPGWIATGGHVTAHWS